MDMKKAKKSIALENMHMDEMKKKEIEDAIAAEEYQYAEKILQDYKNIFSEYDDTIAILDAGIGEYYGDRERVWEAIQKGLMFNIRNYELYVMLGNYYLPKNVYQTYLCYENALFHCDDLKDKLEIRQLLCELKDQNEIIINKISIIILSDNSLEKTKLCIESIRMATSEDIRNIIVVDNASIDGSIEWLREQKDITLIENKEKKGFSEICNQGISVSQDESDILLLSSNSILLLNTLFWLRMGLYDNNQNGMAGCISDTEINKETWDVSGNAEGLFAFGEKVNKPMKYFYTDKISLRKEAFLIRRSVINKIGLFDENFWMDDLGIKDYGLRVLKAGYKNIQCKNSFAIYLENILIQERTPEYHKILQTDSKKINEKWGFNLNYYLGVNQAIVQLIDESADRKMRILEIGCGCGALMEYLKSIYPNAKMYGMELVPEAAEIASYMGEVICGDVENEHFPWEKEYFDYIILGDVLEHLMEPKKILKKLRRHLKTGGRIITSMPNMKHYSVLIPLLRYDVFSYVDAGILDRTHVKMYTKTEIYRLLTGSGYEIEEILCSKVGKPDKDEYTIIKILMRFMDHPSDETFLAYQYICRAVKR